MLITHLNGSAELDPGLIYSVTLSQEETHVDFRNGDRLTFRLPRLLSEWELSHFIYRLHDGTRREDRTLNVDDESPI